jgi:hypothetical protein
MAIYDPEEIELFFALEILQEQEDRGYGPFDAIRYETEWMAW